MKFLSLEQTIPIETDDLQAFRERILQALLVVLLLFGTLMFVINLIPWVRDGDWGLIAIFTFIFLWVLGITLSRRVSYNVRAISLLVPAYALGPITLLLYGLSGDGRIWTLFFMLFTAILYGWRAGIIATFSGTLTYAILGYLMSNGIIPVPATELLANSDKLLAWATTGATILYVALIIITSLGMLLQGLGNSLNELSTALASERRLAENLEKERTQLEQHTAALERRVVQIRTAAEISSAIVSELDPQALMDKVANLIKERFNLYYVGVFLLDEHNRYAVLTAGTGEAGRRMLEAGHRLSVGGSSMVGWAIARRQPRATLDVGQEAIRFNNPHLPLTRSELALPLVRSDQAIGALTVQSVQPQAFDENDVIVLQSIADNLANALENARMFQQIENSLEEIRNLNRQYLNDAWTELFELDSQRNLGAEVDLHQQLAQTGSTNNLEVPLRLRGEEVIGNITLETERSDWTAEEIEFIEAVSAQAALALESARLLEETQRIAEREQTLNQITARLSRTLDFDTLLQTIVRELSQLPKVAEASIHIAPLESDAAVSAGSPAGLEE